MSDPTPSGGNGARDFRLTDRVPCGGDCAGGPWRLAGVRGMLLDTPGGVRNRLSGAGPRGGLDPLPQRPRHPRGARGGAFSPVRAGGPMLSAFPDLSVASARRTLLPRARRVAVARDPGLGGGNLWQTALAHSRDPDAPLVVADPPVPGVDGAPRAEFGIAALCALADAWSSWYLARGVRPRDRVALYLEDSFEEHAHLAALA